MTRKGQSITLSVEPGDKEALEAICVEFGQTWGDKPNLSALFKAIAKKQLKVVWADSPEVPPHDFKRQAILKAFSELHEAIAKLSRLLL